VIEMAKIYMLKFKGGYQHYTVKDKSKYVVVHQHEGKDVYAKLIKAVRKPTAKARPPIQTDRTIAKVFLKDDYGATGHKIWLDCWISKVFGTHEKDAIERWIRHTKQFIRDWIISYGDMYLLSEYIIGVEIEDTQRGTVEPIDTLDYNFQYSHDGKLWKNIPITLPDIL